jgi:hypothetical protein
MNIKINAEIDNDGNITSEILINGVNFDLSKVEKIPLAVKVLLENRISSTIDEIRKISSI